MSTRTKAYLAFLFICIVWGTTYLAIRFAVAAYPPFLFAAVRQVVSALIIAGLALFSIRKDPAVVNRQMLWRNARIGFLMITVGNGVVSWAEKSIPSGVAALVCSLMPLITVLMSLAGSRSEKLTRQIWLGMALGFGGVALIFRSDLAKLADTTYLFSILGTLCATSGWAAGSILAKKSPAAGNALINAAVQLAFGGIFLAALSPLVDDYSAVDYGNEAALWSFGYLVIFGSVMAYTAYLYALRHLPVGLVTSYAYVNPLVAVIMGFLWGGEMLNEWIILSAMAIIGGVFLVNNGYARKRKKDAIP